jgi:hypothetical protein
MRVIRKSVGEQNNEKGSSNLVMVPHRHLNIDGTSSQMSLLSLDFNPVMSKSKVEKEIRDVI